MTENINFDKLYDETAASGKTEVSGMTEKLDVTPSPPPTSTTKSAIAPATDSDSESDKQKSPATASTIAVETNVQSDLNKKVDPKPKLSLIISNKEADQKWQQQISKTMNAKMTKEAREQIMQQCDEQVRNFQLEMLPTIPEVTIEEATPSETTPTQIPSSSISPIKSAQSTGDSMKTLAAPSLHSSQTGFLKSSKTLSSKQANVGFSYLDNLLRLIDRLTELTKENENLKQRCRYLEDTKELLASRNEMLSTQLYTYSRHVHHRRTNTDNLMERRAHAQKNMHHNNDHGRKRCSSDGSDEGDGQYDLTNRPCKHSKLRNRSLSVGSLNMNIAELSSDGSRGRSTEKSSKYLDQVTPSLGTNTYTSTQKTLQQDVL